MNAVVPDLWRIFIKVLSLAVVSSYSDHAVSETIVHPAIISSSNFTHNFTMTSPKNDGALNDYANLVFGELQKLSYKISHSSVT